MPRSRVERAFALALLAGCAGTPAGAPAPPTGSPIASSSALDAGTTGASTDTSDITIEIEPVLDPAPLVRVRERLPARFKDLSFEPASAPKDLATREDRGAFHVSYAVPAAVRDDGIALEQHALRATGARLLLLPGKGDDLVYRTRVRFVLATAAMERAASSFGVGADHAFVATLAQLRSAAFLAGPVYEASFETYEGKDEFAWVGYSAFDPRWIAAEVATTRTAANEYFGEKTPGTLRMLLSAESRADSPDGPITVIPRTRGLLVLADMNAPWSIRARMAVTSALVGRWMTGRFDPILEPGLVRFVARDLSWRTGTMTPAELGDEVNGLASLASTSAHKARKADELVTLGRPGGALLSARVALWATRADALVQRKTQGKRTLRDVVLRLLGATKLPALVDRAAMTAALASELDGEEAAFSKALDAPAAIEMPKEALGKCFTQATLRFEELDLGFDEPQSRAKKSVTGVVRDGPAARAGLADGDALLELRYDAVHPSEPARVVVKRGERDVTITYKPVGRTATGVGFKRVADVPDSACRK